MAAGSKFAYADDLAILHNTSNRQALEKIRTQDMATLCFTNYLYKIPLQMEA